MNQLGTKIFMALLVLVGSFGMTFAQMSGSNYTVPASGPVGGGGNSSSASYAVVGAIPLGPGGLSAGSNYTATGGITTVHTGVAALTAFYIGNPTDTVTVASQTLKVVFSGGDGIASGMFYHRFGGQTSYQSVAMTAGLGDTLVATVPAANLNVRSLEYYFAVTSGTTTVYAGSAASPYVFVCEMANAQCQRPDALPDASYRLIGLPVDPHSTAVTAVFPDDLGSPDKTQWRLGSYNSALDSVIEYPGSAAVAPGQGYWLIARGSKRYGVAGYSLRPNRIYGANLYYEVSLDSGWNQLANPLPFDVSWPEVLFDDNGSVVAGHPSDVLDDQAYSYNGSTYQVVNAIGGWNGIFVFIKKQGIKALFRYREAPKGEASPLKQLARNPAYHNWSVHLELSANGLIDNGNLVGVRADAADDGDDYDLAEPPPAPGAPRLAFRLPGEKTYLRRVDYRAPYADGAVWQIEFSATPGRVLVAEGLNQIPDGMEIWMALDNGSVIRIKECEPIELADDVVSARLIISDKQYLTGEADVSLPLEYALHQNYPNPFNGATTISFTIKEAVPVNLGVYNIIGQRIKTLVNTEMNTGEYTVVWDGTNEDGVEVASGIYFYRMTAGEYVRCRKMLFLK